MRSFKRPLLTFMILFPLVFLFAVPPLQAAEASPVISPPEILAPAARLLCDPVDGKDCLGRIALVAVALLFAFLTVVEVWQIQAPGTSLTGVSGGAQAATTPEEPEASAKTGSNPPPARKGKPSVLAGSPLFASNFSLTVLSGLGGLAAISVAGDFWGLDDSSAQAMFLVFFVGFFLAGLLLSATVRGLGEAVRSRIVLRRAWPVRKAPPEDEVFARFGLWLGYWMRRGLAWLGSFRATIVVFLDTLFNVLQGKAQVQTALLSETITNHHEALLEAAERVRFEVHQAVIRALLGKPDSLPGDLPHEERVRVAISLLSSDGSDVHYIASERGSAERPFGPYSVAWVAANARVARWVKTGSDAYLNAVLWNNKNGEILGPRTELPLKQYYQPRGDEDYKAFIVLPMPWCERGRGIEHRRGLLHISFKEASYLEALWAGLERSGAPNYDAWHDLLSGKTEGRDLYIKDPELGSVLFLALESLGEALGHFNDEVYDVYIQARRHAAAVAA